MRYKAAGENDVEERKSLGEWARIPKKGESGKEKGLVGLCRDDMCEGSEKVIQVIGYSVFVDLKYTWAWEEAARGLLFILKKMEPLRD